MTKRTHTAKKRNAYRRGIFAEYVAAVFLLCKGYRILAVRKRMIYEADLIARKRDCLILIEVKYRRRFADTAEAITPAKQHRLYKAALMMPKYYGKNIPNPNIRIDAVLMSPRKIRHLQNIIVPWY